MNKLILSIALAFAWLCYAPVGNAFSRKTVCSMALNSSDEFQAFQKSLSPQGFDFIELVPDRSHGSWLKDACRSNVQCDVLLISGHFGGLFFGESKSNLLELAEIEQASCNRSCDGIFKRPKEVFLMGCNTLADHSKDHRTLSQYLQVLINDGFPLGLAEEVAVARYGGEGLSLADRFSHVFGENTSIYGFSSTGPIGARAAPSLSRYLKATGDYHAHLESKVPSRPNLNLKNSFGKSSFKELLSKDRLSAESAALICQLQSDRASDLQTALQKIDETGTAVQYIDRIREALSKSAGGFNIGLFPKIISALSASVKRNSELFEVQFKNLQAMKPIVNSYDRTTLEKSSQQLINSRMEKAKSLSEIQRLCQTGLENASLVLDLETFKKIPVEQKLKYVLLGCFSQISEDLLALGVRTLEKADKPQEQEYLYFNLRRHLSDSRLKINFHAPFKLTDSVAADLKRYSNLPPSYRQCLNQSTQGDGDRWHCWQKFQTELNPEASDLACLATLSNMERPGSKDFAWQCLKRPHLTIGRCLAISNQIAELPQSFEQMHDDLLWNCYSTLLDRMDLEPASCLMLQRNMKIRGHRIKMQWNCMNRLPK